MMKILNCCKHSSPLWRFVNMMKRNWLILKSSLKILMKKNSNFEEDIVRFRNLITTCDCDGTINVKKKFTNMINKNLSMKRKWYSKKSHRCKEGGALTPSKDESRWKILCFRVQVHVRPRKNLAVWLEDKNTVKQPPKSLRVKDNSRVKPLRLTTLLLKSRSY